MAAAVASAAPAARSRAPVDLAVVVVLQPAAISPSGANLVATAEAARAAAGDFMAHGTVPAAQGVGLKMMAAVPALKMTAAVRVPTNKM